MCACEACMSENAHLLHTHTHTHARRSYTRPSSHRRLQFPCGFCDGGGEGGAVGRVQGVG